MLPLRFCSEDITNPQTEALRRSPRYLQTSIPPQGVEEGNDRQQWSYAASEGCQTRWCCCPVNAMISLVCSITAPFRLQNSQFGENLLYSERKIYTCGLKQNKTEVLRSTWKPPNGPSLPSIGQAYIYLKRQQKWRTTTLSHDSSKQLHVIWCSLNRAAVTK